MRGVDDGDHRAGPLTERLPGWDELPAWLEARGVGIPPSAPARLRRFWELLRAANQRTNLTRLTGEAEVLEKHILDALLALPLLDAVAVSGPCFDLGSGCGVPGIPLAIVRPEWAWVLVESTARKAAFLESAAEALELSGLSVRPQRAELLGRDPAVREQGARVVARAVGSVATCLELGLPLVRPGGRVVLYRGPEAAGEPEEATQVGALLGGGQPIVESLLLPSGLGRRLIAVPKERATPARFPRRDGVPARRPLRR